MDEQLSIVEYLENTRPYLSDMTNDLKETGKQKIHVTRKMNFIQSKDEH